MHGVCGVVDQTFVGQGTTTPPHSARVYDFTAGLLSLIFLLPCIVVRESYIYEQLALQPDRAWQCPDKIIHACMHAL